jgi:hypothetical protein
MNAYPTLSVASNAFGADEAECASDAH